MGEIRREVEGLKLWEYFVCDCKSVVEEFRAFWEERGEREGEGREGEEVVEELMGKYKENRDIVDLIVKASDGHGEKRMGVKVRMWRIGLRLLFF